MKARSLLVDGFETSVAEKMPKMKKLEDPSSERDLPGEALTDVVEKKQEEEAVALEPVKKEGEQAEDVFRLIEDLHGQLLVSNQTRRAMETELSSFHRTIHQLTRDNQEVRRELENLKEEHQRLRESQSELLYLQEENADALDRIQRIQGELKETKEALSKAIQERDEALSRIQDLEFQMEQGEITRMKGRLKEREASQLAEENKSLHERMEEVLTQNIDLEKRYETMRKSFNEVRESLTLLRDSCKRSFYNLSDAAE
ncbi:MAG: hypothetical protein A2162_00745 [Deltaproteobacteria bacterium RBG_13_52_11b]|nr:MAG: hypothetical protein A2162_00745 [Deltaproteobacteria bacterium RBG_13_52_11b]